MDEPDSGADRAGRRQRQAFRPWLFLSLALLAGLAGLAGLALTGRMVAVPAFVAEQVEARINAGLAPAGLQLGGLDVMLGRDGLPVVHLSEVAIHDRSGRDVARLPEVEATLSGLALLEGRIEVIRLALSRANLTLRRAPDGAFDLALGNTAMPVNAAGGLAQLPDQMDRAFAAPGLARVEAVRFEDLRLTYEDARAGRTWRVDNALLTLEQTAGEVSLRAVFAPRGEPDVSSEVAFSLVSVKDGPEATLSASFSDIPSADVASQSPALAPLAVIDAPISGSIRTGIDRAGRLGPLSAALEIGAGSLHPTTGTTPIRFAGGTSHFSYDPEARRLNFDQIAIEMAQLRLSAEGHADLHGNRAGWPETLVAQLDLREVVLDPEGVFERPVLFTGGALDLKLDLDPFSATLGQLVLLDGPTSFRAEGRVRARPEGWDVALDGTLDLIAHERLLALWPMGLLPGTRRWFAENVVDADLHDLRVALRLPPDRPRRLWLSHEFRDAEVVVLQTMPPVRGGHGYATIEDQSYTLSVEAGEMVAPDGGRVDVAGTVFRVPDVTLPDPPAEVTLRTASSIASALALTDLPPLEIRRRAGLASSGAEGRAELETVLRLPLRRNLAVEDVTYSVSGLLREVRTDGLIAGRHLAAQELTLRAVPGEVTLAGGAALAGIPLRGSWTMDTGPAASGASRVEGTVELSSRFAEILGLDLPPESLVGTAWARFGIELQGGAPRALSLASDLRGLGLRLPDLGWSKATDASGSFEVTARLGQPAVIERIGLEAPGISASGAVFLRADGGLEEVRLDRLRLGDWLDAPVTLTARGQGRPPALAIAGGRVDLRELPERPGASGAGGLGPVEVALDRLVISDAIALGDVRGQLSGDGGLSGALTARMEDGAPIRATLVPARDGTAIRIRSEDAGGVLRGLGVYRQARGGALDLALTPEPAAGFYRGRAAISDLRVKGTPVLVELLAAISVVGVLELLDGEGLMFSNVDAQFRLRPGAVEITEASAVGPSLGISMSGHYGTDSGRMDMRGVISPVYLLNSIGSVLTRAGEGLFGFTYRLVGDARDPEVRVNPLSILTPGMFREIFRSPSPMVPQ